MLFEILLDKRITDDEIKVAMKKLFALGDDDMFIRHYSNDMFDDDFADQALLIEVYEHNGDFPYRLSIAFDDDVSTRFEDEKGFAKKLSGIINASILVDDGDVNPYTAILITRKGDEHPVHIYISEDSTECEEYELQEPYRHLLESSS